MDYAFRNSSEKESIEIHLGGQDMTVISDTTRHSISYADITEVRLSKKRDIYFLTIIASNYGSLLIPSQSFAETGERIDQARIYTVFIRLLHMYLLEKNKVNFITGFRLTKLLFWLGIWITLCTLTFTLGNHFDFFPENQLLKISLILFTVPLFYLGFQQDKWPRSYSPSTIPLTMLPACH